MIRREIYNVKGWIPGLVSTDIILVHSWQDLREKQSNQKEETSKRLWSWDLGLKGRRSNGERIALSLNLDYSTPSHANLLKLEDTNANDVIRNKGRPSNATVAKN